MQAAHGQARVVWVADLACQVRDRPDLLAVHVVSEQIQQLFSTRSNRSAGPSGIGFWSGMGRALSLCLGVGVDHHPRRRRWLWMPSNGPDGAEMQTETPSLDNLLHFV